MKAINYPTRFNIPFANAGGKNTIPEASQIGITPGAASLSDGFPPLTRTALTAGGVPPSGLDMNGILYEATASLQWANAGGLYPYDSTFSTAIGGYPKGAPLISTSGSVIWVSAKDDNTTDPDAGTSADWIPVQMNNVTTVSTTPHTLTVAEAGVVLVDDSSSAITLNAPPASSLKSLGYNIILTSGANGATFVADTTLPDSVEGSASISISDRARVVSNGVDTWFGRDDSSLFAKLAQVSGQRTLTDITAGITSGTVYQNTTGREIYITANIGTSAAGDLAVIYTGPTSGPLSSITGPMSYLRRETNNYAMEGGLHMEVPPGWYYSITVTGSASISRVWSLS